MSLLRATATVSMLTFLSRVTGLLRDTLIAHTFGANALTDAFWVAFRIPNLLRRLFAEGAFSQAFVPIVGEAHARLPLPAFKQMLDRVATVLFWALVGVTVLGILSATGVVWLLASGMRSGSGTEVQVFDHTVLLTRIMFPYIFCMSMVALCAGVLNIYRQFSIPALTPVLLNLCMIAACTGLSHYLPVPIYGLAFGVLAGGILQLAIQAWALARLGVLPRIDWHIAKAWRDSTVQRILRQMLPALLGVSVAQISLIINTNIATWLTVGSVSWLSFADRLMEFPTGLLGVALGTVLLPNLSRAHANHDTVAYSHLLDWGLRLTLLLGAPAALGLALLSDGLVATLFHYGAFDARDVHSTASAVSAYSVGLLGFLAIKVLAPGFYAKQDIRTPVKIGVMVLIATQLLNLLCVPRFGHAGLALAISLGACANAAALWIGLWRRGLYQPDGHWGKFLAKLVVALAAAAAALLAWHSRIDWISLQSHALWRALVLGGVISSVALVYFSSLWVLGFRRSDLAAPG